MPTILTNVSRHGRATKKTKQTDDLRVFVGALPIMGRPTESKYSIVDLRTFGFNNISQFRAAMAYRYGGIRQQMDNGFKIVIHVRGKRDAIVGKVRIDKGVVMKLASGLTNKQLRLALIGINPYR